VCGLTNEATVVHCACSGHRCYPSTSYANTISPRNHHREVRDAVNRELKPNMICPC
jgi:hypothetical protein